MRLAVLVLAFAAMLPWPGVAWAAAKAKPQQQAPADAAPRPRGAYIVLTGTFVDRDSYARFAQAIQAPAKRFGAAVLAVSGGPKLHLLEGTDGLAAGLDSKSLLILSVPNLERGRALWADLQARRALDSLRAAGPLSAVLVDAGEARILDAETTD